MRRREKKGILVASTGTTRLNALTKSIAACEYDITASNEDYEIRRGFTSRMIIEKLKKKEGVHIDNPVEALDKMDKGGFSKVLVQPLHVIAGTEFHDLVRETREYRESFNALIYGDSLLHESRDYQKVARTLGNEYSSVKSSEAIVLVGHGTSHPANSSFPALDYVFKDLGMENFFVGTIKSYPGIESVVNKLKENTLQKVHLVPLMLVAGTHAKREMAGKDKMSWKSVLESKGFEVEIHIRGLGENREIRELYERNVENKLRS